MKLLGIPRVSTGKQAKQGDSVEAQKKRFEDYCKLNNHALVGNWEEDVGHSASMEDKKHFKYFNKEFSVTYDLSSRKALSKFIENIDSEDFDGILIFKWDRVFRDPSFADAVRTYAQKHNKVIIPTDDPEDVFSSGILQHVSKYEIQKLKGRIRQVRQYRFEKGMFPARSPYGYRPIKKDKKVVGFKIDPKEAKTVRECFNLTISGHSYSEICKKLKLKPQQYYNIIRNKSYCSYVSFEKQERKGTHEPIISEEVFNEINSKR